MILSRQFHFFIALQPTARKPLRHLFIVSAPIRAALSFYESFIRMNATAAFV